MAYELKTIFTVKDQASAAIRNMLRQVQNLDRAITQLSSKANQLGAKLNQNNAVINNVSRTIVHNTTVINNNSSTVNHNSNTVNNNTNTLNRNTNVRNTMINTIGRESSALRGLGASLVSVAGLYAAAQGASKAFNATIGAAAQYQQAEVAVKAIFNDDEASKAYLKMVDKMAIDSPLLNSGEMLKSSKTLVAMTKNVGDLGKAWSIIERLMVLDPTQGTEGAAFALKEMWQGDALSMVERFGLSKKDLNVIKKMEIPEQIAEINKLLDGMGITQGTVNAMGQTTLGYWAQIEERASKFLRIVGASGNTKLGKVLGDIVAAMDNVDLDSMAKRFGDVLGDVVEKVINVGKWMWKWREPLAWATGAITAAATAFAGIGLIAALASPISLIAAAIGAAGVGMYALWNNSESFRGAIGGAGESVKRLWDALKDSSVGDFFKTLKEQFTGGLFTGILQRDQGAVAMAVSIGQGIKAAFDRTKNALKLVADFIKTVKEQFTGGLFTGILQRDQGVVQMAIAFANGLKSMFDTIKEGASTAAQYFGVFQTYLNEKLTEMAPGLETLKGVFSSVWTTLSSIFTTVWSGVLAPGLASLWNALQILGNIAVIVFNNVIAPGLQFAAALFSVLWSVAGPILKLLGAAVSATFAILKVVWDTILAPLVEFILGGVKSAFEVFTDAVNVIGGAFSWVGGIIDTVASKIRDFVGAIKNVKLPDWVTKGVSATVKWVGGAVDKMDAAVSGSHYHGLTSVPYDNYLASLHKGEMVLTRQEAEAYRGSVGNVSYERAAGVTNNTYNNYGSSNAGSTQGGGGISITGNQFTVREESDIKKVALELAKLIEEEAAFVGQK